MKYIPTIYAVMVMLLYDKYWSRDSAGHEVQVYDLNWMNSTNGVVCLLITGNVWEGGKKMGKEHQVPLGKRWPLGISTRGWRVEYIFGCEPTFYIDSWGLNRAFRSIDYKVDCLFSPRILYSQLLQSACPYVLQVKVYSNWNHMTSKKLQFGWRNNISEGLLIDRGSGTDSKHK